MNKEQLKFVLDSMSSAAIIVAAVAVVWMAVGSAGQSGPSQTRRTVPTWISVTDVVTTTSATTFRVGNAAVALIEFSDFQCPFCGRFATQAFPQLKKEYIDPGKIEYVFRNYPLQIHPLALRAAYAGVCASQQGQFHRMHNRLFRNQNALGDTDLLAAAAQFGLNTSMFEQCMASGAAETVAADKKEGDRLHVNSTPTIMLGRVATDGRITVVKRGAGAVPFELVKAELDKLLTGTGGS